MITLVLGGNKSGKSDHALKLLDEVPGPHLFVATGKAHDAAFNRQIQAHRKGRNPKLPVREVNEDLPEILQEAKANYAAILVDGLDYWLYASSGMTGGRKRVQSLLDLLSRWDDTRLILVSCEIGLGPLPADGETRRFARALGALNHDVAALAHRAYLVAAGLPITLKD